MSTAIEGGVSSAEQAAEAHPQDMRPSVTKLIGSYERNLDSKLRIGLPHQFRDRLDDQPLILIRWMKRSIALFPECNWEPIADAISRLDLYTDIGLTVRHQIFAYAREVKLDGDGRIVIPNDMVQYARLEGKVMLLGDWDKITIWSMHRYQDQVDADEVNMSERFPAVMQLAKGQKSLEAFEEEVRKSI
mgnify:CR=1 FL=1